MFPSESSGNSANCGSGYGVLASDRCAGFSCESKLPNFEHFFIREFRKALSFSMTPMLFQRFRIVWKWKVLPIFSVYYVVDACYSIFLSNFKLRELAFGPKLSNFQYLCGCQFCPVVRFSAKRSFLENIVTMPLIFGHCAPFQVVRSWICLVSVFVIDALFAGNGFQKCESDKPVQADRFILSRRSQANVQVSLLPDVRFKQSNTSSPRRNLTSYAAKVRDAVKLVSFNWTPFFGSAIKWFGHKLYNPRFTDLAPMSVQPLAGVNFLYAFFLRLQSRKV